MTETMGPRVDRIAKLGQVMAARGIQAYIAASGPTMNYLHGLSEEGGERLLCLLIHADGRLQMIAPALAETQARRCGVEEIITWRDGEDPFAIVQRVLRNWGVEAAAYDDDGRASHLLDLQAALPEVKFVNGHPLRTELTAIKTEPELYLLHQAGGAADRAFNTVLPKIKAGLTEKQVAEMLFEEMTREGGAPTFAIIAAGPNGAEPHHYSDDTPLREGDVVIMDFGCEIGGYQSDITRTISIGEPADPEADRVYASVYAAHHAGRAQVKPGTAFQEADRAARQVLNEAGYGEFFTHRLGHGVGMNVHEKPDVVEGETTPMAPGHCFSIEPGVYLTGRFGVRIENLCFCSEDGGGSFNEEPSDRLIRV